jgi:hypothetical protein
MSDGSENYRNGSFDSRDGTDNEQRLTAIGSSTNLLTKSLTTN